jgi:hypothetical protein
MFERIGDMPAGTIGFEVVGEVEDDDWEASVEPVLRSEIAEGRELRVLYLIGPRSREIESDAIGAGAEFRARHLSSFERVAIVSDEDWVRPTMRVVSVLLPGQVRGFRVADLPEAKSWLSAEPA